MRKTLAGLDRRSLENQVVSLKPPGASRGNVLLSYHIEALVWPAGDARLKSHTAYWQSAQMAHTFVDLGYSVDVIHFLNQGFRPEKAYSVVVDTRHNLERLSPQLGNGCLKIFHIDTAHMLFTNAAEAARLLALQRRRGVTLEAWRTQGPNQGIEHADCGTTPGNAFTISTFEYAGKPIYRVPIPAANTFEWPAHKDWEGCRNRFLFFSSSGLVLKGLDLVLEAFAKMPDCHLTICAPVEGERRFARAYHGELYESANIHTVGWVDAGGETLRQIADSCAGLVFPSASEGASTSTIECMHMGVVPIVSRESGVDMGDFGVLLESCSVEDIRKAVRMIGSLPADELASRARKAYEYARANHTRAKFAAEYRSTVAMILERHGHAAEAAG